MPTSLLFDAGDTSKAKLSCMERAVKNFKAVNERWRKVKVGSDSSAETAAIFSFDFDEGKGVIGLQNAQ